MNKRSVFSNDGVDIAQPQQVQIIQDTIKTVEAEPEVVEEKIEKSIEPEKKKVSEFKQDKLIVGNKEFLIKSGLSFFTVNANVKIGSEKYNIQRVVQEKNVKLANIEYDRIIKKEFGKPKSITGRTIHKYRDGDEEFMVIGEEKKLPEIPKTQEELDLEKKIALLTDNVMGIFKVTFSTKYIYMNNATQYIFAQDSDGVYDQLDRIEQRQDGECNNVLSGSVKQIVKMTESAIKMDKACLKHLAKHSVEDIQEMYDKTVELNQKRFNKAVETYKELKLKGFRVFAGKVKIKQEVTFIELARSEEEGSTLMIGEARTLGLTEGVKDDIPVQHKIIDMTEEFTEGLEDEDEKAICIAETIKRISKKEDTAYDVLFDMQDAEQYIDNIDNANILREKIKNGTVDNFIKEKVGEKIDGISKVLKNVFGENSVTPNFKKEILEVVCPNKLKHTERKF